MESGNNNGGARYGDTLRELIEAASQEGRSGVGWGIDRLVVAGRKAVREVGESGEADEIDEPEALRATVVVSEENRRDDRDPKDQVIREGAAATRAPIAASSLSDTNANTNASTSTRSHSSS